MRNTDIADLAGVVKDGPDHDAVDHADVIDIEEGLFHGDP